MSQFHFTGHPRGWFVIGFSEEFKPLEVVPLRYFSTRLVAYRGESGAVLVLDALCPHLGADLGVGGRVVGDTVECPFHAWRYDGTGRCVSIPYASKIPSGARVRSWETRERNGMVFVFHARDSRPPEYEIPIIEDHGRDGWTEWSHSRLTIRTHPREIVENVADKAHFPVVHGTHVEKFSNEYRAHMAIQRTAGVAHPRGGGEDRFRLEATYHGPAYQVTVMEGVLENRLINCHTPIDENHLHLRFAVSLRMAEPARAERFAARYVENLRSGFAEDIAIWENKLYRDVPVLCDGDGPVGRLRKWYQQFYTDPEVGQEKTHAQV